MRILLTLFRLSRRLGGEWHIRDLAVGLARRGHDPVVYTPDPGVAAEELRQQGVAVVDRLDRLREPPGLIHGHDSYTTLVALGSIPRVPAVTTTHSWDSPLDVPLRHPRLLAWVATGTVTRQRLVAGYGVDPSRVMVIANAVDLRRFARRAPLSARPNRALVFNNYAIPDTGYVVPIREACDGLGIQLDIMGEASQRSVEAPEQLLGAYDVVFATGRSALESAAVGCAVVLCATEGVGPMLTTEWLDRQDRIEFGRRHLRLPITAGSVAAEVGRYDAVDAAEVSARVRDERDLDAAVDDHLALYKRVVADGAGLVDEPQDEQRAIACWLANAGAPFEWIDRFAWERISTSAQLQAVTTDHERLRRAHDATVASLSALERTRTFRARRRILQFPGAAIAGRLARKGSAGSNA